MHPPTSSDGMALLTAQDRERLTVWKCAYTVYSDYYPLFSLADARRLLFARFLFERGRLLP